MKVYYIIRIAHYTGSAKYFSGDQNRYCYTEIEQAKRFDTRTDAIDFLEKWIKDKITEFRLFEIDKIFDVSSLIKRIHE